MADTTATPTSNPAIRVLTALGAGNGAQEVTTIADSAGNLLGTAGAPFPVAAQAGTATIGGVLNPSATRVTQSITAVAAGAAVSVAGYQSVLVTFTPTAISAFSSSFQISDDGGTSWYSATGRQTSSLTQSLTTANTNTTATAWQVAVVGATHFRLNTTTFTGTSMAAGITPVAAPTNVGTSQAAQISAVGSGGATKARLNSAATTNATSVKASAGSVYGWVVTNTNAAARFLKLYDLAAAPTVGTSVPAITISVPAASTAATTFPVPIAFTSGISFATTTVATDADTTAVAAGDLLITLLWA